MQHPEARRKAGFRVFLLRVLLLYLDEFGHDGIWDPSDPAHRHHPLFGLAGIAVPGERARDLDRGYLRLKLSYYAHEVQRAGDRDGLRPERYEPKQLQSRRDFRFATAVADLVGKVGGHVFAQGVAKRIGRHGENVYENVAKRTLTTFEHYLRQRHGTKLGCGVIVLDRRDEVRDLKLLEALQRHLFSTTLGYQFRRISETPLLVRSDWYHGVQAADTIARSVGTVHRHRHYGDVANRDRLDALGTKLDTMTYRESNWSTVHIAGVTRAIRERDHAPLSQPVLSVKKAEEIRKRDSQP